jgi:hypothetical protein
MWEYFFGSDLAFDLVKGLVAGGASLALQVAAPQDASCLEAAPSALACLESRQKGGPQGFGER